ncbi:MULTISPECIES: hypothetical protein [Calothrix]|uniref:Uncharacterized protein n=2 Tax=Calothrix TaxID=1186 RepID=A0ABR8A5I9_9CYAN|nr:MULTISPECIES: hypothetical protein [Calothrix]MBD2195246.1 hypothetical protein [Calothrix parietina FACHB-288]MBD2223783.1 hypothetical protein [Calothrix anomala FACHB-343]
MPEYTLIIRDILAGNKEVIIDSIVLSGLYEQHPQDFFASQTAVGLANRERLRQNLQEKLARSAIGNEILDYIIAEWCQGIKEHYKRRFILAVEISYSQSSAVNSQISSNNPQQINTSVSNIKVVDRKKAKTSSAMQKPEVDKQDNNSTSASESATETEAQISSRAATDKWSLD